MAVINANNLAIYYDSVNAQEKAKLAFPYATTAALTADAIGNFAKVIVANEDSNSGENNLFIDYGALTGSNGSVFTPTALTLVGAATNSTLDLSNSIEDVARDGDGGTLQESIQEWSLQADGLIEDENDAGESLLDMARNKYYAFVKFSIDKGGAEPVDYYGQVLLESVQVTGGVDEIATYSVTMRGVDSLLKG